jgi:hypothetical protein
MVRAGRDFGRIIGRGSRVPCEIDRVAARTEATRSAPAGWSVMDSPSGLSGVPLRGDRGGRDNGSHRLPLFCILREMFVTVL